MTVHSSNSVSSMVASEWDLPRLISTPLTLIDDIVAAQPPSALVPGADWQIPAIVANLVSASSNNIPSLNTTSRVHLHPHTLVRYRGLVTATETPEYFSGVYMSKNIQNGTARVATGKYRDEVMMRPGEMLDKSVGTFDRLAISVAPVPGETRWIRATERNIHPPIAPVTLPPQDRARSNKKRAMCDDSDDAVNDTSMSLDDDVSAEESSKRVREFASGGADDARVSVGSSTESCTVLLYDSDVNAFKIGDVVEFVGVYSITHIRCDETEDANELAIAGARLHCLAYKKVTVAHPLVPPPRTPTFDALVRSLTPSAQTVRTSILSYLTAVSGGDSVTAECLLLTLIAHVHSRQHAVLVGKLNTNVIVNGGNNTAALIRNMSECIELLMPRVVRVNINRSALNESKLMPVKDLETDVLGHSPLVCAPSTVVLLDESDMTVGPLNDIGTSNMTALSKVMSTMKLTYDYGFQLIELDCDLKVVAFSVSHKKSLFPSDLTVSINNESTPPATLTHIDDETLSIWRQYLCVAAEMPFTLAEANTQDQTARMIEEEFIRLRRADPSIDAAHLHRLLTVARITALSYLQPQLTVAALQNAIALTRGMPLRQAK